MNRRKFLKLMGIAGGGILAAGRISPARALASEQHEASEKRTSSSMGVIVDTTLCVGCRSCESACNEANQLPKPATGFDDDSVFKQVRSTSPAAFTVVNRYSTNLGYSITRKQQCMHCVEPACSSACVNKAMIKTPEGPVIYRSDLCIGCRYCMIACPFEMPKFEYDKARPFVRKCQFCFSRIKEGQRPACVAACPAEALSFGPREEIIDAAKAKIYTNPKNYIHRVYGEQEIGGTSWMYLSAVPFEQLGLPEKLGKKPYPELTSGAMAVVPIVMLAWPALLTGFNRFFNRDERAGAEAPVHEISAGGKR